MENRSTFHYISTASTEKMWLENLDPASHGRIFFRKNEGACGGGWKIRIWRQNHAEIPNFNPYFAVLWGFIRKEAWWLTTDDVVVWRQMAVKSEEVIKSCLVWCELEDKSERRIIRVYFSLWLAGLGLWWIFPRLSLTNSSF